MDCGIKLPTEFDEIINSSELSYYSPIKLYLIKLIYDYCYISELNNSIKNDEFEEDIFDFWNQSEFSLNFYQLLNSNGFIDSSKSLINKLELKIINFFNVQIKENFEFEDIIEYQKVYELGDQDDILNLPEKHIRLYRITSKTEALAVSNPFLFLPSEKIFEGEKTNIYISKICHAYKTIEDLSSELYDLLQTFTHTIVPTSQPEIVSHSSEELPGFSTINLTHRDELDLLDDLIHENGHHYLNHYLTYQHLLIEDDEKIFFSPWRGEPRAIRGIFHAYLTFYWAFYLFKLIITCKNNYTDLGKSHQRFLEEYYMLNFSYDDLVFAHSDEKISDEGLNLVKDVYKELQDSKKIAKSSLKYLYNLDKELYTEVLQLKNNLDIKRKEFKVNY